VGGLIAETVGLAVMDSCWGPFLLLSDQALISLNPLDIWTFEVCLDKFGLVEQVLLLTK
jgi:hypothetical protein